MKKFLVAMAAVMAMTVSINAKDNNKAAKATCTEGQCTEQQQCKGDKQCAQGFCPFEGLNLTEAQQAQIKELQAKCAKQKQDKKDAKQQDKAAKKAAKVDAKKQCLAQIKSILTPEQYIQFLENSFINNAGGQKAQAQRPGKSGKGMKQGMQRPGKPGERPERPAQQAPAQQQ